MTTTDDSSRYLHSDMGDVYSAYCRGRLGVDPGPNYRVAESAAHLLGVEGVGGPIPDIGQVAQMVVNLLSVPPAASEKPDLSPVPKSLSPRVLEILGELGLDPNEFHRRGATTPTSARAQLARRAVILRLRAEGLCAREIAAATLLDPWTARAHLRAARQRPGA